MKIFWKIMIGIIILSILGLIIFTNDTSEIVVKEENQNTVENEVVITEEVVSPAFVKIELQDVDGNGTNYTFQYEDEVFQAIYANDSWRIIDSYKIKSENVIKMICEALIEIHPIHGKDMVSFRTVEDLTYEWLQHNLAYELLPENNSWRKNAKDVDLDPYDQGRTLEEMYEARTGKQFSIKDILSTEN